MTARVANRRIRLLVAVFALVFAVALARAGWLQAVRAQALERLATNQHRETIDVPGAPRDDLRPHRRRARDRRSGR